MSDRFELDLSPRVLYKDGLLLVLDKPAGLAVHAGGGKGPHLGQFLSQLSFGKTRLPELAHRLDRETSGCLALGRHPKALRTLAELFAQGRVEKVYQAWVEGDPPDEGVVEAPLLTLPGPPIYVRQRGGDPPHAPPLGRGPIQVRQRGGDPPHAPPLSRGPIYVRVDEAGQPARTRFRALARRDGATLLELRPETGRTHQLRVHCAHLGCPIRGDERYGRKGPRMLLHARSLTIPLYPKRDPVRVEAPFPEYWP